MVVVAVAAVLVEAVRQNQTSFGINSILNLVKKMDGHNVRRQHVVDEHCKYIMEY